MVEQFHTSLACYIPSNHSSIITQFVIEKLRSARIWSFVASFEANIAGDSSEITSSRIIPNDGSVILFCNLLTAGRLRCRVAARLL